MGAGNEKVAYWRGKHSTIPSDIISGRLLFEQDTGDVFFDYKDYDNGELKRVQITDTTKMNISGGTFTGDVILVGDPKDPLGAVTKQYADKIQGNLDSHTSNEEIHITQPERQSWNNKVDKVDGKQLSTNDFTDELKSKLDGISEEATKVEISLQNNPSESEKVDFINLGYISINNVEYQIYMPAIKDITGNAETASRLKTPRLIDGVEFDGTSNVIHYGLCQTAGATDIKDVTIHNFKLQSGSIAYIYFRYQNKSTSAQLNISDTGSYPIYYLGSPILEDQLNIGLYEFVFIDGSNKRYEMVASVDTKYGQATETQPGLLTPEDKQKLDSIEYGANNYVLPISTKTTLGGVKIGDNITSETDGTISINQQNIISALGYQPLASDAIDGNILYQMLEEMVGATSTSNGQGGLVPTPFIGDQDSYLCGDGKWKSPSNVISSIPLDRVAEIAGTVLVKTIDESNIFAIYDENDKGVYIYNRSNRPNIGQTFDSHYVSEIISPISVPKDYVISSTNLPPFYQFTNNNSKVESFKVVDLVELNNIDYLFYTASNSSFSIDISNLKISHNTSAECFIYGGVASRTYGIEVIGLDNLNTSNLTSMKYMLSCVLLDDLDLSSWDTSNVTDMSYMFYYCRLSHDKKFNIPNTWNTSKVTNMSGMFYGFRTRNYFVGSTIPNDPSAALLGLQNLDTSNVTNMSYMFYESYSYPNNGKYYLPDLSSWDTSNVTDMSYMFYYTNDQGSVYSEIDYLRFVDTGQILNWDLSSVKNIKYMFHNRHISNVMTQRSYVLEQTGLEF